MTALRQPMDIAAKRPSRHSATSAKPQRFIRAR